MSGTGSNCVTRLSLVGVLAETPNALAKTPSANLLLFGSQKPLSYPVLQISMKNATATFV